MSHKFQLCRLTVVILILALVACAPNAAPEVTPTEEPTPTMTPTEEVAPTTTPTEALTPTATPTEAPTPTATPTEAPTPAVEASPTPDPDDEIIAMGETLYLANCADCHGAGGQGVGGFPPLDGSPVVTAEDPSAAIRQVLFGGGPMPAFQNVLDNEEIAAVLSYVRNAWTNDAPIVEPEQVEQER